MSRDSYFTVKPATLDAWEIKSRFEEIDGVTHTHVSVVGYCERRRNPLFHWNELFDPRSNKMGAPDAVAHFMLVCFQDRPTSQRQFEDAVFGGFMQEELF